MGALKQWKLDWGMPPEKKPSEWHDPWAKGTIGEFLEEFLAAAPPELSKTLDVLPESVRTLLLSIAQGHTLHIAKSLDMEALNSLEEIETHGRATQGMDTLAVSLFPMITGYLATQFLYQRTLKPFPVEFHRLKARMAESLHRHIETALPGRLAGILGAVMEVVLKPQFKQNPFLANLLAQREGAEAAFEDLFFIEMTTGAVIWQIADSIRSPVDPVSMATARLFLSYSSIDKRKVRLIEGYLRRQGLETWRDEKDLVAGAPLLDTIRNGIISETDYVVVFISQHALQSRWVSTEIRIAYQRELEIGKTVLIPVIIDDCSIPAELGIKKYVDARRGAKRPADEISAAVKWHTTRPAA